MFGETFAEREGGPPQVGGLMKGGDTAANRQPEAARALSRQISIISELESVFVTLTDRLEPVLRAGAESKAAPTDRLMGGVALVRNIDENSDRIQRINVALLDLIDRLEV